MIFNDLLLPGLDCKITPGKRDLFLAGITILGDEITGITGQEEIFDIPICTRSKGNHFVGVNKMVWNNSTGCLAGFFCFFNHPEKISPFLIPEKFLQIPGEPEFNSFLQVNYSPLPVTAPEGSSRCTMDRQPFFSQQPIPDILSGDRSSD